MLRKLGLLMAVMGLALPAWCAAVAGSVCGCFRRTGCVPQVGAAVELLGSAVGGPRFFTDERGFYSLSALLPGTYNLKVSAPSFLPALREKVGLRPGAKLMVNVTLTTLFDAIQLGPLRGPSDEDDWKWTLRSVANRSILRVLPDGTTAVATDGSDHDLKGSLVFMAGSESNGFGSASDMSTGFSLEHSLTSAGTLSLNGNLGYGSGLPAAGVPATHTKPVNGGVEPNRAFTVRRPDSADGNRLLGSALPALSL